MKEVSGNYFYNPNIKTSADDGDGFYSAGTSTKDVAKDLDFYGKYYLGPKEKLKKYNIDIEDNEDIEDYEDAEEYSPMYDIEAGETEMRIYDNDDKCCRFRDYEWLTYFKEFK